MILIGCRNSRMLNHHMNCRTILFKLILPASFILFFNCHQVMAKELSVKKVYSGNTIKLKNGKKIEYIGVDTPGKGKPFFDICKKANKSLVDKKEISIKTDVLERQDDGKLLGYVYADGTFVNSELIKRGYALAYIVPPNESYRKLFLSLQEEARKNRRGLWAFEDRNDEPYYLGSKISKVLHRPGCFHAKHLNFDDRIIIRTKDEALSKGFTQDWRCCPLFKKPDK